jgi:hypothetical protein
MRGSNPNATPMRPYGGMTPNPNQGIATPKEQLAGDMTLQTNVPGTPTNTGFNYPKPPAPTYGYQQQPTGTSSYGAPQIQADGTRLYNQQMAQQASAPHPGQKIADRLVQMGAAPPSLMNAYLQQNPGVPPHQIETGYHAWASQQAGQGLIQQVGNGWAPTQAFYQQYYGYTPGANGQLVNTGTQGGQALSNHYAQANYSGMGPYGFQPTQNYGYSVGAGAGLAAAPGGGNTEPFNSAAPAAPAGMPTYSKNGTPLYPGVSPVGIY